MKATSPLLYLLTLSSPAHSSAFIPSSLLDSLPQIPLLHQQQESHSAMSPPPSSSSGDNPSHQPSVPLADILGTMRSLTTFSSLSRLHESTSSLLSDLTTNTTVLAPLNSAIENLPRKPWEEPGDVGVDAYEGDKGRERAQRNLRKFVEAHLVAVSPWEEVQSEGGAGGKGGQKTKTMGGREIWWEWRDGGERRVIMPDEIEVEKVAKQVANGEVWILKGVLNYV